MGKFSWSYGHQKQPSDKFVPFPEWFSRASAEPSRQALNHLVRERLSTDFENPAAQTESQSRSRSGTLISTRSHRARSSSDRTPESLSRPQSRQRVAEDVPSSPTRHEPMSRSLFSKGSRIMRRKNSRLTLLSSQVEEGFVESHRHDPDPYRLDFAAQMLNLSPRRTNTKPNISVPFGFQHVTHTDQGQFQSLNSTTSTELVCEFNAVQTAQSPAGEIRGISVDDLPASPQGAFSQGGPQLPSPTSSILPELPMTPPKPQPPPKDDAPPMAAPNIRLSRSVENFSRPKRSPTFAADISPISEVGPEDSWPTGPVLPSVPPSPSSWAEATNDTLTSISSRRESVVPACLLDKPLPQPPTVVHAVSTADDSALPLRSAPLPQLPLTPNVGPEETAAHATSQSTEPRPATPRRGSLRHMQTFPSSKAARRRSQSSGEMTLGAAAVTSALASPVRSQMPKPTRRPSIGIKKIDIEDWEDAIDYSWDYPLDLDEPSEPFFDHDETLNHYDIVRPEVQINSKQDQPHRPLPLKLTPVMEQETSHDEVELLSPTTGYADTAGAAAPLQGLGIDSYQPASTTQVDMDAVPQRGNSHEPFRISAIRREPGSPISKSSSQESIILSIASSIMGTHRSSNSSTSLSDLSNLAGIENDSVSFITDDAKLRAQSNTSDSSQNTVTTESHSVSTLGTDLTSPPASNNTSPAHKHERGISLSRINVPNRTSSIAAARPMSPAARQRSSTLNTRPKNLTTRASYSLFPATRPSPP